MLLPALLVSLSACTSAAYIDLSYPYQADTLYYLKENHFVLTPEARQTDPYWLASNKFSTAEHGGTHIDAPYHYNRDGWKLGQIPLSRLFMVEGILINKTEEVLINPEYQLTVKDILDWEKRNGHIPDKCVVLVDFGWGRRYPNRRSYLGVQGDDDLDRRFPNITREAAQWFVDSGKVFGVGIDTASPYSRLADTHIILNGANIFILENLDLKNLKDVPSRGFKLVILPIKIEEGTGGPTRVVLVTKDKKCDKNTL